MSVKLAPSILSADFSDLKSEVKKLEKAGADLVHIDIMDGCFVENITIGAQVVKALRRHTNLFFDVHLMVVNPEKHIDKFIESGADNITVHAETTHHLDALLNKIKSVGKKASVAINPATPIYLIENVLEIVDMVLVMTVNPGYGGQKFIPYTLKKIQNLSEIRKREGYNFEIEVDGGINEKTIVECVKAGADVIVAGSYVFESENIEKAINKLKNSVRDLR
ncbi:Ribulose-phosphate 3-epimerase [Caldicellulosiruptor saccharolyticus DSM 8903]|uniref:Ribulose-phosphate 3-epimerase n=1 Tax=Caldicellulosiruptor saccharolyticus (strain ATCC 43494 / DSM 8903 / Tp8T 6331) TaxID=351627 RepID=A4XL74_CALS8|nr:ribulose-phosphate 3-epimerase [Caldicellulosiruptor saccharolyticus]ABP67659.1 Ribulose-phosphate 3-epimerase [Caldicellulosiruptor saccharolyticus DSM 8903]